MIPLILVAPPTAPQTAARPAVRAAPVPALPPPPKLDWLDQFIVDFVRENERVKTWQALNAAAQELTPRSRSEAREARLRLLPRIRRLLRRGLLFRAGRNSVATFKRTGNPRPRRPRRRKPAVTKTNSQNAVSAIIPATTPEQPRQANQVHREVLAASRVGEQPTPTGPKTESAPDPALVSQAASELASQSRKRRRWGGWFNDGVRSYRNQPIQLRDGRRVYVRGVRRGLVVFVREPNGHIGDPD